MKCCGQGGNTPDRLLWDAIEGRDAAKVQELVAPIYQSVFGREFKLDATGDTQDENIPGYQKKKRPSAASARGGSSAAASYSPNLVQVITYDNLLPAQQRQLMVLEARKASTQETPLWYAACRGDVPIVKILASAGANLNPVVAGQSLMHSVVRAACQGPSHDPQNPSDRGAVLQVLEYLAKKGTDCNALAHFPPKDTPFLFAVKCGNEEVALALVNVGANARMYDEFRNRGVHVAAAQSLERVVDRVLDVQLMLSGNDGGSQLTELLKKQNADGHSAVMSARLAVLSPQLQLSPTGEWLHLQEIRVNPGQQLFCSCCGAAITTQVQPGTNFVVSERVWFSGSLNWVKCQLCGFSPHFPSNHVLACVLAIRAGDIYSLTDAVEGCWLAGLTPPNVGPADMHPKISEAISKLVTTLQAHLRLAIENQDVRELERGIEMLSYSKIAGLREDSD